MDTNAFVTGTVFVLGFLLVGFLIARSAREPGQSDRPARRSKRRTKHLDPIPEPISIAEIAQAEAEELDLSAIRNSAGLPLTAMLKTWHRDATPSMKAAARSSLQWTLIDGVETTDATPETLNLRWISEPSNQE